MYVDTWAAQRNVHQKDYQAGDTRDMYLGFTT